MTVLIAWGGGAPEMPPAALTGVCPKQEGALVGCITPMFPQQVPILQDPFGLPCVAASVLMELPPPSPAHAATIHPTGPQALSLNSLHWHHWSLSLSAARGSPMVACPSLSSKREGGPTLAPFPTGRFLSSRVNVPTSPQNFLCEPAWKKEGSL